MIIKKSKFICRLYYVNDIYEINSILEDLKKEYKDATHICYAYVIDNKEKAYDDGEPSKTAGMPILEILKKKDLNNVLCVVIRYFGGIKLGAGGLIRAYSNSVRKTIDKVDIISYKKYIEVSIEVNYDNKKLLESIVKDYEVINKDYKDTIPNETYNSLNLDKNYLDRYFFLLKYKLINEINDLNKYLDVKEGIDIRIKKVIYKVHTYQELIDNIKTKRFTYNKLNRMFLHIFFNVLKEDNNKPLNYIRILGFNQKGRLYLKTIKNDLTIPLITNYKEELIKEELKSIPIKVDY